MNKNSIIDYSHLIFLQTKMTFILGRILNIILPNGNRRNENDDDNSIIKVLVLKTDEIGDFVLATAFLRELRLMLPRAQITLVVSPTTYNLAELCPYVDEIMVYRQSVPRYIRPFILTWRAFKLGYCTLRQKHFDIALMPRWDTDGYYSAYVAYFSCAKRRVGYAESVNSRKRIMNKGFDLMFTEVLHDEKPKHEVERYLDFIRYYGGNPSSDALELWTDSFDDNFAERVLANISTKMLVAFCPGAGAADRQWPADRFIELGQWLKKLYGSSFIIIGGANDINLGRYIKEALNQETFDLTGRTTLRQTATLLKRCHLYVGNDTGAMHIAAAVGVPIVEISCFPVDGPNWHWNSPSRFAPWKVPHRIVQTRTIPATHEAFAGEHSNSISEISVEQVQDAIRELFHQ
jgi:ADP-heptose:LPS heptosyltransferase